MHNKRLRWLLTKNNKEKIYKRKKKKLEDQEKLEYNWKKSYTFRRGNSLIKNSWSRKKQYNYLILFFFNLVFLIL